MLPPKELLRAKLHELYAQLALEDASPSPRATKSKPRRRTGTKR